MRGRMLGGAAAVLLAALALQLVHGLRADGLTNDEILYISAGWRQLAAGDHRLNTTHPPLAADLAALGLLGLRPRLPPFADGDDVMAYCYRFLHVDNAAGEVIPRARLPVVVLTLALALLCAAWAREAGGDLAGLLALALAAFHPSLIAHGHLATTDLPATFAMVAASWCFWRWTRRPALRWALATAAVTGIAVCTRLTAWVLPAGFGLLALGGVMRAPRGRRLEQVRAVMLLAACGLVVVPLVAWAAYGFGVAADGVLPAPYLEAARFQVGHNRRGHLAYLLGERSRQGWPHYFAVAFLVKSTPGYLAAMVVALVAARRRAAEAGQEQAAWAHWLLPAAATFAGASAGAIQIGERYLLPVHAYLVPALATALARVLGDGRGNRLLAGAAAASLLLHIGPGAWASHAGTLAYQGPAAALFGRGRPVLLDSNLDWGQDLPRLARWMRRQGIASVQLGYMGTDDPARFGIDREDLPGQRLHPLRPAARPLTGTVVVSPNLVYGLVPASAPFYESLRGRRPDGHAGVFLVYRFPE